MLVAVSERRGRRGDGAKTRGARIEHQMALLAAVRDALQEALDCDHDDPMECPYFRARLRSVDPIEPETDVRTGRWHDEDAHHGQPGAR